MWEESVLLVPDKLKHLSRIKEKKRWYKSLPHSNLPVQIVSLIFSYLGTLLVGFGYT